MCIKDWIKLIFPVILTSIFRKLRFIIPIVDFVLPPTPIASFISQAKLYFRQIIYCTLINLHAGGEESTGDSCQCLSFGLC